ncbi:MAG: lytic transglycosylase domain-containing protein [Vulcanimicrobiaceae bacterium]
MCFAVQPGPVAAAQTMPAPTGPAIHAYANVLQRINPQMPAWQSQQLAKHVLVNAARWRVDANLLVALVKVESDWHTHAVSWAGAIGLGQLMPGTAARLGVNPFNPLQNLEGAARYLGGLLHRFKGRPNRYALACAAYNAGAQAVIEYGGIPPYYQTQHYVVKVLRTWHEIALGIHLPPAKRVSRAPDVAYWTNGP